MATSKIVLPQKTESRSQDFSNNEDFKSNNNNISKTIEAMKANSSQR